LSLSGIKALLAAGVKPALAIVYLWLCVLAGVVGIILVYFGLCFLAGFAGRRRRIGFWGYFFSSVIFTPVIGLLFLYFASPRKP